MELLFVCDPLESFKIYKDTTFAMMREAARRGVLAAAGLQGWRRLQGLTQFDSKWWVLLVY